MWGGISVSLKVVVLVVVPMWKLVPRWKGSRNVLTLQVSVWWDFYLL